MIRLMFSIFLTFTTYRVIRGFFKFNYSWNWFIKNNEKTVTASTDKIPKIIILIPVLREQNIIHKTLERFTSLQNIEKIIFITTEKENLEKGSHRETTREILEIEKMKYRNVEVIHYPETFGVMSHQLNYACNFLQSKKIYENDFILVYNADSEIFQDTIYTLRAYISNHGSANVIQQSAVFIGNYSEFPNTFSGAILKAVALYQSRWTFSHEIFRLINQLNSKNKFFKECGHVVGHGLCIRLETLVKVGYFPSDVPNEDMALGFFLRLSGEKIHLLPRLEIGESPRSLKSVITQYTSWFYGVIYYPVYAKIAINKYPNKKLQTYFWTILNTIRALIWLSTTYIWIFLLAYSLLINKILFVCVVMVFMLYSVGNNFKIYRKLKFKYPQYFLDADTSTLKFMFGSMIAYLFQSVSPTIAIKNIIVSKIFGRSLRKNKTER